MDFTGKWFTRNGSRAVVDTQTSGRLYGRAYIRGKIELVTWNQNGTCIGELSSYWHHMDLHERPGPATIKPHDYKMFEQAEDELRREERRQRGIPLEEIAPDLVLTT